MGPWSRSFIAAVAGNAERPNLEVTNLRIEPGVISATVEGCEVTITAPVIPARIWTSVTRFAKGMGALEDAVEGRVQSVHLEHLLEEDWDEQLIPRPSLITQATTCVEAGGSEHPTAVAYSFADELEVSPRVLLLWRGVAGDVAGADAQNPRDPWRGGELTPDRSRRAMPPYAVLKRLGSAEMPLGVREDLATFLRIAYTALVSPPAYGP